MNATPIFVLKDQDAARQPRAAEGFCCICGVDEECYYDMF